MGHSLSENHCLLHNVVIQGGVLSKFSLDHVIDIICFIRTVLLSGHLKLYMSKIELLIPPPLHNSLCHTTHS